MQWNDFNRKIWTTEMKIVHVDLCLLVRNVWKMYFVGIFKNYWIQLLINIWWLFFCIFHFLLSNFWWFFLLFWFSSTWKFTKKKSSKIEWTMETNAITTTTTHTHTQNRWRKRVSRAKKAETLKWFHINVVSAHSCFRPRSQFVLCISFHYHFRFLFAILIAVQVHIKIAIIKQAKDGK